MASNDYHFITTWRIPATPEEISAVLGDAPSLPDGGRRSTWRSGARARRRAGHGKLVDLYTKGFLPYTLRWRFTVTESEPPTGFSLEAVGDFVGRGIWTLRQDAGRGDPGGPLTSVTYDWLVIAEKGILKNLSFIMKPIFSANHRWAMARGEESLKLELARRRAADDATVQAAIPAAARGDFPAQPAPLPPRLGRDATASFVGQPRHPAVARQLGDAAGDPGAVVDLGGAADAGGGE